MSKYWRIDVNNGLVEILLLIRYAWYTFRNTRIVKIGDEYTIRKGWIFYRYKSAYLYKCWFRLNDYYGILFSSDLNVIGARYDKLMGIVDESDYGRVVYVEREYE